MHPRVFAAVFQSSAQSFGSVCELSVLALLPSDARKPQTDDGDRAADATMASDCLNLSVSSLNTERTEPRAHTQLVLQVWAADLQASLEKLCSLKMSKYLMLFSQI